MALKHFIAAVKGDNDLQACGVLETCLFEVATGTLPHMDAAQLLAMHAYHQRLQLWAAQEAGSDDPGAVDLMIKQAMKGVSAANMTPRALKAPEVSSSRPASSANAGAASVAPAAKAAAAPARGGGGWLPQAFVKDFNEEGDEFEPDLDGANPDEGLAEMHADEGLVELQGLENASISVKVSRVVFSEHAVEVLG